ncbi:50S ribosomal protein L25 [Chloroflexota bacterium]|nr:50S ribosomal protein L25 [Chloroflexota bacterium]
MTDQIVIKADPRTVKGKKVGVLRREGILPGIIYGKIGKKFMDPIMVQMNLHDSSQIIKTLTQSSLVKIEVEGKQYPVVLREVQKDVIYGTLRHVDFMALDLTQKLQTSVPIELVGEAPAASNLSFVVMTGISELEIECLPQDMPERIEVDASVLVDTDSVILVKDLKLSDNVEILTPEDEMIAGVTYVAIEEEPEAEAEGELADILDEGNEPEVIEKGKQEEGEEE